MCVKIVKPRSSKEYDITRPLEEQLKGSKKVVIDYSPNDPSIDKFVNEVERICKNGISCSLNIEVTTNNIVKGAKVKKEIGQLVADIQLNNLIKLMALVQSEADKKLEEMSELCLRR